jgi:hypothetical protein
LLSTAFLHNWFLTSNPFIQVYVYTYLCTCIPVYVNNWFLEHMVTSNPFGITFYDSSATRCKGRIMKSVYLYTCIRVHMYTCVPVYLYTWIMYFSSNSDWLYSTWEYDIGALSWQSKCQIICQMPYVTYRWPSDWILLWYTLKNNHHEMINHIMYDWLTEIVQRPSVHNHR